MARTVGFSRCYEFGTIEDDGTHLTGIVRKRGRGWWKAQIDGEVTIGEAPGRGAAVDRAIEEFLKARAQGV